MMNTDAATTETTVKYPAARAEILALADKAAESFSGLDWDTGPEALASALANGRTVDVDDLGGTFWRSNPSLDAAWRSLCARVEDGEDDLAEEAADLRDAEAADVETQAENAAELGRDAADYVGAGRWEEAIDAAEAAAAIERYYGDAPAWGGLVAAIKSLPEYLAADAAAEDYHADDRSDDEIRAEAVDVAGQRRVCESLERLINGVGFKALGMTGQDDPRFEGWCDRYVAAWAAEVITWCDL